jgi:lysine-specific demethylase/histidyl-hydroxylase NO66
MMSISFLVPFQGFQVHYDDIEAFVLQLEGSKRWRVYRPRTEDETLPKHSSRMPLGPVGRSFLFFILKNASLLFEPRL